MYLTNLKAAKTSFAETNTSAAIATYHKLAEKCVENKGDTSPKIFIKEETTGKAVKGCPSLSSFVPKESVRAARISDYTMGLQIGQGAYATVKQGTHKLTGRKVAIKIYEKYKLIEPQRKISVNREIQILKKLNHINIVKLNETIDTTKQLYLIMELAKGKSLHSYLHSRQSKRLEESEALTIFKQVLEGIEHCHKNFVSHRDIKAENILLSPEHEVKIIDFGFSICSSATQKLKIFCGTPSYMAPEIVNRKEYSGPLADMWSLGVLLYLMLSGNPPFRGFSDRELFRNISRAQLTFPVYFSQGTKNLLAQILQAEPQKRPSSSEVLIH